MPAQAPTFATDDQTAYLDAWQSVDSDDLSAIASAKAERDCCRSTAALA